MFAGFRSQSKRTLLRIVLKGIWWAFVAASTFDARNFFICGGPHSRLAVGC